MSFNDPATNKEVLIPRVGITNGIPTIWSEQQAINNYYSTGKHLGKFATPEEANAMAEILHNQQARYYNGK